MCFNKGWNRPPLIAAEDIIVYKEGLATSDENKFHSRFLNFAYKVGKIYKKNLYYRFRAYRSEELQRSVYHSYNRIRKWRDYSFSVGEFVIPKGTKYWQNKNGEIASFKLKYTGKIVRESDINELAKKPKEV